MSLFSKMATEEKLDRLIEEISDVKVKIEKLPSFIEWAFILVVVFFCVILLVGRY